MSRRLPWRLVAEVVAVVAALWLLLWGADLAARTGAQSLVARVVQDAAGTGDPADVTVGGGSVLLQAVRGSYDDVDVTARGVSSGPLRLRRVDAHLADVRVPLRDLLLQDVGLVAVGRSVQRAQLTYADLDAYLAATGRPLRVAPGQDGAVRLTGTVEVLGTAVDIDADAALEVEDGVLVVSPPAAGSGAEGLDVPSRLLLGQRLTVSVPLPLPFGLELTGVEVRADHLLVTAEGSDVTVRP